MDCEHTTSSAAPQTSSSAPSPLAITNTQPSVDREHTHTRKPQSTLSEVVALIPPSLFSVTHGHGAGHQQSLTARLTFALTADLFFSGTTARTGAAAGS